MVELLHSDYFRDSGKYSKVVSIPKTFLRRLGWKEGQKVVVEKKVRRKEITIRDFKDK